MSPQQEEEFRRHLAADGYSEEVDEELRDIFNSMDVRNDKMADTAYKEFNKLLGGTKSRFVRIISVAAKVAACLAVPLLGGLLWAMLKPAPEPDWLEVRVPNGQTREIVLSDNSVINLNAGSRMTYPSEFRGANRTVFIDGEVMAEISKDPKHPFIIESDDVRVKVLGTKFNLRSYSADKVAEVQLLEGSVALECGEDGLERQLVMRPGDRAQFNRSDMKMEISSFDPANNKSFMDGDALQFYNLPLSDIVRSLERHFGVEIIILNQTIEDEQFFALFTGDEELDDILLNLDIDGTIRISHEGDKVFIK